MVTPLHLGIGILALSLHSHTCALNNAPPILHSGRNGWVPLFPVQSTSGVYPNSLNRRIHPHRLKGCVASWKLHDAREFLLGHERWISCLLVLAAAEAGAHSVEKCQPDTFGDRGDLRPNKTGSICDVARRSIATDTSGKLELEQLRRRRRRVPALPPGENAVYYPSQLRAP